MLLILEYDCHIKVTSRTLSSNVTKLLRRFGFSFSDPWAGRDQKSGQGLQEEPFEDPGHAQPQGVSRHGPDQAKTAPVKSDQRKTSGGVARAGGRPRRRSIQSTLQYVVPIEDTPTSRPACRMNRSPRRFSRSLAMVVLIWTAALGRPAVPALAHALVQRSDPPANQLVLRAPKEITLVFSEPFDPQRTEVRVLDQDGRRVDRQGFRFSANRREARVPVQLPGPGIYTVTWRTLSAVDLHTYDGFFTFTLGPLRPGSFAPRSGAATGPSPWEVAARWLMFVGAAVLVGGLLIQRFLLPAALDSWKPPAEWMRVVLRRWRFAGWLGAMVFLIGVLGELAAQAARAAAAIGEEWAAALAQLSVAESTRVPLLLKIPATLILLTLLQRRAPATTREPPTALVARTPALPGIAIVEVGLAGLMLLGISLTSHAAAAPTPLPLLMDWLHLASAAVWVGGLAYLALILAPALRGLSPHERTQVLGPFAQLFSNLALASVSMLILTGLYAAWANIPSVQAVPATAYGRTLAIKLAILVPLLATAAVNLLVTRPRLLDAARQALADAKLPKRFVRLVRSEVALATLVLLAAAVLALLPTARQVWALGPRQEIALVRRTDALEGALRIVPYQVGENAFELRLRTLQSNLPVPDARVRFTFLPLGFHLGTTVADASPEGDGRYVLRGSYIGTRGPWLITVTVRQRGEQDVRLLYPVEPDWVRGTPITPPTDPDAMALLRRAEASMNRLRTLRQRQEITDGAGNDVVTFFELAAPNILHYRVIGGYEVFSIGETTFFKEGDVWRREPGPGFKFPNFAAYYAGTSSVVFGPREIIDGRETQVVTFILGYAGSQVRYWVWIDVQRDLIVQEGMVARSHFMIIDNFDFNTPVRIPVPR